MLEQGASTLAGEAARPLFDRRCGRRIPVLHDVGVFGGVFVVVAKHRDGPEAEGAEEELGGEVGLADLEHDSAATVVR